MKKFEVYFSQKGEYKTVDENWLENVDTIGISSIEYDEVDRLYIVYRKGSPYEKHVVYKKVFGNWAFPTTLV